MLSNVDYYNASCFVKRDLGKTPVVVECNFTVEGDTEISKILSVTGGVVVESCEPVTGETIFSGHLALEIIYSTPDGEIGSGKATSEFSGTYKSELLSPSSCVTAVARLINVSCEKFNGDGARFKAEIEVGFCISENLENKIYKNDDPEVFCRGKEISVSQIALSGKETFTENTVVETRDKIKNLLSASSSVVIKKTEAANGFIIIEGDIENEVFYCTEDDPPRVVSMRETQEFREEIEADGLSRGAFVEAFSCALCHSVEASIEPGENGDNISIKTPISIRYVAYRDCTFESVDDLYSASDKLNVKRGKLVSTNFLKNEYYCSKIEGNMQLGDDRPRVDKVLAFGSSYITPSNVYIDDENLVIEGVAYANLIYLNDEENSVNSAQIELPFMIKERTGITGEDNIKVHANSILTDVDIVVKRGRDVFFDAKVRTFCQYYTDKEYECVTDISSEGPVEEPSGAIEIYFAKSGQTFWDIAKEVMCPVQDLIDQNYGIAEPFSEGERIVLYRQKVWKD